MQLKNMELLRHSQIVTAVEILESSKRTVGVEVVLISVAIQMYLLIRYLNSLLVMLFLLEDGVMLLLLEDGTPLALVPSPPPSPLLHGVLMLLVSLLLALR